MSKSGSIATLQRLLWLLFVLPSMLAAQTFTAQRLNGGEPILSAQHFLQQGAPAEEGGNINGPSVIRIPDWIPPAQRAAPDAVYYMYFAHHSGDYIRMAWAQDIEGPWQLYRTGATVAHGERGVLDMGADRRIELGSGLAITSHIASPDVHVDNDDQQIVMYFHGVTRQHDVKVNEQQTYVAISPTGLDFSAGIVPFPLGASYLRVFEYAGRLQGLTPNRFHRPRNSDAPWEVTAESRVEDGLWEAHNTRFLGFRADADSPRKGVRTPVPRVRHLGVYRSGDTLHVFFTMLKQSPERILATAVDLSADTWFAAAATAAPAEILRAEREWEGAQLAPRPSKKGAVRQQENALLDPFVFSDAGALYLFYAGGGEQAIGVARLLPQGGGERGDSDVE